MPSRRADHLPPVDHRSALSAQERAALDALPDEPGPWTEEQDAILVRYWGKKRKDLLVPRLLKLLGRSVHAIECRTVQLRAEGRDIERYVAKKRKD